MTHITPPLSIFINIFLILNLWIPHANSTQTHRHVVGLRFVRATKTDAMLGYGCTINILRRHAQCQVEWYTSIRRCKQNSKTSTHCFIYMK